MDGTFFKKRGAHRERDRGAVPGKSDNPISAKWCGDLDVIMWRRPAGYQSHRFSHPTPPAVDNASAPTRTADLHPACSTSVKHSTRRGRAYVPGTINNPLNDADDMTVRLIDVMPVNV